MSTAEGTEEKFNPDKNYDIETMEQQKEIERLIKESQPLIGCEENFSSLEEEYRKDASFLQNIQRLKSDYKSTRRSRGDGNCFYRAFGFAYVESLMADPKEYERFKGVISKCKDDMIDIGMPDMTITDFYDTFVEVVDQTAQTDCSVQKLLDIFNSQSYSDYIVVFLRLLVSCHLQKNSDFFAAFVDDGLPMKQFCAREVEPMARECDHIHITALTSAVNIPIRIEYLDRNAAKEEGGSHHDFPDDGTPRRVYLLYRLNHYDILYPIQSSPGLPS